jgi:transcriptional regulator with XRE-family HTH domain
LHDVVVANLTGYRHLRGRSQEDIATDMSGIDHPWTASTVSDVENGERSLSIDELGALAMVLETTIPALIDCGGVDGTDERDLQIGYGKLPAWFARTWLRGKVFPHVQRDTSGRLRLSGMGVATDTTPDPASVMAQGLLVLFGKRRKEAAS